MRLEWDSRQEMRQLRAEVDRAFRQARQQREAASAVLAPPLDAWATAEAYELVLDLPGVTAAGLEVQIEPGLLTISAEKAAPEGGEVLRRERAFGRLARAVPLPEDADVAQVSARLQAGQLWVTVARRAAGGRRRVEVSVE
jgi:HSP20 family protein